jgi:cytochrome c556
MKNKLIIPAFLVLSTTALAHNGATGVVKERMDGMGVLKTAFKQLVAMTKPDATFKAEIAQAAIKDLSLHAKNIPALFTKKDLSMPSESMPAIWEDFADFSKLAKDLEMASDAAITVNNQAELRTAVASIGVTCTGCHKVYRVKKD